MIGKAAHVAETTGVKVCQIFSFVLLYTPGFDKEMSGCLEPVDPLIPEVAFNTLTVF